MYVCEATNNSICRDFIAWNLNVTWMWWPLLWQSYYNKYYNGHDNVLHKLPVDTHHFNLLFCTESFIKMFEVLLKIELDPNLIELDKIKMTSYCEYLKLSHGDNVEIEITIKPTALN